MTLRAVLALAVLLGSGVARAGDDYDTGNKQWNGLSTLGALARGAGLEVIQVSRLDWESLGSNDIVFMIYPTDVIEPNSLAAFIRKGGRVLFADDFGRGADAIQRLSMLRQHGVGVRADFYQNLEFAPVARAVSTDHPLARDVEGLTTNHPAVFTSVKGPEVVFGFGANEAVVVAGAIGAGRFVALSDPSVLINRMLEFEGNLQFTINLFRFLSTEQTSRVVILKGDFFLSGEPKDQLDQANSLSGFTEINNWLEEINDYFLTEESLRILGILLAFALALGALISLPMRHRAKLDGAWIQARPEADSLTGYQDIVERYERGGASANWALPAAMLRDNLVRRLRDITGLKAPLDNTDRVYSVVHRLHGMQAAELARRISPELAQLPSRAHAASNWHPPYVPKRDFDRLLKAASELCRILDGGKPST